MAIPHPHNIGDDWVACKTADEIVESSLIFYSPDIIFVEIVCYLLVVETGCKTTLVYDLFDCGAFDELDEPKHFLGGHHFVWGQLQVKASF